MSIFWGALNISLSQWFKFRSLRFFAFAVTWNMRCSQFLSFDSFLFNWNYLKHEICSLYSVRICWTSVLIPYKHRNDVNCASFILLMMRYHYCISELLWFCKLPCFQLITFHVSLLFFCYCRNILNCVSFKMKTSFLKFQK